MEKFDFARKVLRCSIDDQQWDGTEVAKLTNLLAMCVDRDRPKRAVGRLIRTLPIELLDAEFIAGMGACKMRFDLESILIVFRGKPDRLVGFLREAVSQGILNLKSSSCLDHVVRALCESLTDEGEQIDTVLRLCELLDSKSMCGKLVGQVCARLSFDRGCELVSRMTSISYFDDLRGSEDNFYKQVRKRAGDALVEAVINGAGREEEEEESVDSDVDDFGNLKGFVTYGGESDISDSEGNKRSLETVVKVRKHRRLHDSDSEGHSPRIRSSSQGSGSPDISAGSSDSVSSFESRRSSNSPRRAVSHGSDNDSICSDDSGGSF